MPFGDFLIASHSFWFRYENGVFQGVFVDDDPRSSVEFLRPTFTEFLEAYERDPEIAMCPRGR